MVLVVAEWSKEASSIVVVVEVGMQLLWRDFSIVEDSIILGHKLEQFGDECVDHIRVDSLSTPVIKISPSWEIVKISLWEGFLWLVMVMGWLVVKVLVSERMT